MTAPTYYVIFNEESGMALSLGLSTELLADKFRQHGLNAVVDAGDDEFDRKIDRALGSDAAIVVAAGGDGTATAIARRLAGTNKILAVLPLGTANLLARDLGIPLSLDDAIPALNGMARTWIDAGDLNGTLFLHKVVLGVVPAIAAAREKARGQGLGQLVAFVRYLVRRLRNARKITISITSRDAQSRTDRVHAIAVANNAYDEGWGKLFARSSLRDGVLSLYVLRRLNLRDAIRLAAKMVAGTWREDETVSIETVRSLTVSTRHKRVSAMVDGEVEIVEPPLRFKIRPQSICVMAPPPPASKASEQGDERDADRAPVGLTLRPS